MDSEKEPSQSQNKSRSHKHSSKSAGSRHRSRKSGDSGKSGRSGRSGKSGRSRKNDSSSASSKHVRECVCGRGLSCTGMTQAFRLLGDPRCYYVELPRFRPNPPAYKYVFRNNLRAAYLRHLEKSNPDMKIDDFDSPQRRFVALHHFHPLVVRAFYENPLTSAQKHKVPISITEHELRELNMDIFEEDRILSVTGIPTGGYYFVPSYPHDSAHDDLKTLIRVERMARESNKSTLSSNDSRGNTEVSDELSVVQRHSMESSIQLTGSESPTRQGQTEGEDGDDDSSAGGINNQNNQNQEDGDFQTLVSDTTASEFDSVWGDDSPSKRSLGSTPSKSIATPDVSPIKQPAAQHTPNGINQWPGTTPTIIESGDEDIDASVSSHSHRREATQATDDGLPKTPLRETDYPWGTPKYRRESSRPEPQPKKPAAPAEFIDPSLTGTLATKLTPTPVADEDDDGHDDADAKVDTGATDEADNETKPEPEKEQHEARNAEDTSSLSLPTLSAERQKPTSADPPGKTLNTPKGKLSPARPTRTQKVDGVEMAPSDDVTDGTAIPLNHQLPGTDPTLRIQIHNDLIAWESKRRSDLSQQLEYNRERWKAAREILRTGLEEVQFAERLVLGFSKAGFMFADALKAMYDDKLLDDAGNTVKNSFVQNRLKKQRSVQEYSIESSGKNAISDSAQQSALLHSIIESQLNLANAFRENSQHMEREILPEITELRDVARENVHEVEALGDSILAELKRSEVEVKNIWDVFDAMVTGDLMEYSMHGSLHDSAHGGGSSHGLSQHPNSVHGFLTPRGDNEAPIISSVHSPLVKGTFRQLGGVEDGWLIEMYYKSAVEYQKSVYQSATKELEIIFRKVADLEELRFRKLHQIMLAFVPRQRRLFVELPEHLKNVLNDLVGLRIDEDLLQSQINESIRDRSHNHLKKSSTHRSSIMNRSRLKETSEVDDIEDIESKLGSPFDSSMIVLSNVVELKPGGLGSIVNAAWKVALAVVTSSGNFFLFEIPDGANWMGRTPAEAFRALYPPMKFDSEKSWTAGRKFDIVRTFTPILMLDMRKCNMTISKMRQRQFDVAEEGSHIPGSRFLNAVNAGQQRAKKCTLRLPSASDALDWVVELEKAKEGFGAPASSASSTPTKSPRFRF